MLIEITTKVAKIEWIDVEFPYYFEYNLDPDYGKHVIYGKIGETITTTITERIDNNVPLEYEIEKEEYSSIKASENASYFKSHYKSSQNDFENAKKRCLEYLNTF